MDKKVRQNCMHFQQNYIKCKETGKKKKMKEKYFANISTYESQEYVIHNKTGVAMLLSN